MRYLLGREATQKMEAYSIQRIGIPSLALMERAALAVCRVVCERTDAYSRVLICCGMGNNGADGLATARMLFQRKTAVEVLLVGDPETCTEEFRTQYTIVKRLGIRVGTFSDYEEYIKKETYDILVDAMFGIGLTRPLAGLYRDLIDRINQSDAFVVSVDMPSGISADTGAILGGAVRADLTVTFGCEKLGLALYPGHDYAGEIRIEDIGLIRREPEGLWAYTYGPEDLALLPVRPKRSHKGTFGRLLIAAGSVNMCGAAYLAAKAAYRSGVGLVRILTPEANRAVLQERLPEAVLSSYEPGEFSAAGLQELCDWADAMVIGPGLGKGSHVRVLVNYLLQYGRVPVVLDADALNLIARYPDMTALLSERVIVTPHLGEMAGLTGRSIVDIQGTLPESAITYSQTTKAVCVLKDARTVVSDGREEFYLNTSGNDGMATAGSGDVLAGILGALLAARMPPYEAAVLGVYLHGLAGDAAAEEVGTYALMAEDILQGLVRATKERRVTGNVSI
ncbi:MAG: NAD(P)H-hydrate dehydratase [Lachnospiraceae bacterium]|nr:NAD(P)H-hydrate dehydratase [Lachnospiraceae bacterium]